MKLNFFVYIGFLLLIVSLAAGQATEGTEDRKQLAGPPEEFDAMRLPQPSKKNAVSESSALLVESLVCGAQQQTVSLPVDSETLFRLTIMSPLYDQLQLQLSDAQGQQQPLDPQLAVLEPWALGDSVGPHPSLYLPLRTWTFAGPAPGLWTLSVAWKDEQLQSGCADGKLGLLLYNENPLVKLNVELSSFDMETWEECGVTATLDQPFSDMESHKAQWPSGHITSGQVEFTLPDHSQRLLTMHDDGQGLDRRLADGIWSGSLLAKQSGTYNARSVVYGVSPLGHPFVRSVQLPFVVLDDHRELTGVATVAPWSDARLRFLVAVDGPSSTKYRAYAQVYGTALSSHDIVPIAWVSALVNTQNITNVEDGRSEYFVALELDLNWLLRAQATGPFELREVSLQCANTGVIISSQPTVTVVAGQHSSAVAHIISAHLARHNSSAPLRLITPEMREGVRPHYLRRAPPEEQAVAGPLPLVLSHGYCSDENPFYRDKAIFGEQAYYFLDAVANRGVDQFALMIKNFAVANGVVEGQPFATIGHSQGGMALTHLLNYYWTGMDAGGGFRPVQSLGTPYQGCTVAGNTAAFGSLFGYGCGANFDLTPAGAALWLPGITTSTRARVSYYTSTYQQGNLLGDYCSLAANSVLKFPNDGVTEQYYASLPGADFQGETQRQCHTSGMKYIPQYHDSTRNAQMNQCARYGC